MSDIKISPKQNVVTIGKQKYKFVENYKLNACKDCAFGLSSYCSKVPCCYLSFENPTLGRKDKKKGIFVRK